MRATQVVLEERLAWPILIGRPEVIKDRIKRFGLTVQPNIDFEIIDPHDDPRYRDYVATYLKVAERKGVTPDAAKIIVRSSPSVIGALALYRGEADALLCGLDGRFSTRLEHIRDIVGLAPGARDLSAMSLVIASTGVYFLADTHVRYDPSAEEIADLAVACAHHVRRFGIKPKIALISHSDFGSADTPSARKMRAALALLRERAPELEVDGEMQADTALSLVARQRVITEFPHSGRSQRADLPQSRRRQHGASTHPGDRRRVAGRTDPDRPREARARADPVRDRARHRQHDRDRRGGSGGRIGVRASPR